MTDKTWEVTNIICDTEMGLVKKPESGAALLKVKAEAYDKIRTLVGEL